MKSLYLLRRCF